MPSSRVQICRWHIWRNIAKKVEKSSLPKNQQSEFMDAVKNMTFSKTEDDLRAVIDNMSLKYPADCMSYLKDQWLDSLDGVMKKCWLEQHIKHNTNFGFSTTSPVEASHHSLKAGILCASATLHASALRLLEHDLWSQQLKDISKSRENFRLPLSIHRKIELTNLITRVSVGALRIIEKEISKMADGYDLETPCKCTAKPRFLLPCRHDIIPGRPILLAPLTLAGV
ncbi:hypothetical protein V1505DRAFT_396435 [Lipomyces doorenjongii]